MGRLLEVILVRHHIAAAGVFFALMAATLPACDTLNFDCLDEVDITVSEGLDPTIDWTPDCEATALWIIDDVTDETMWVVEGRLKPHVKYGKNPSGAKTIGRAKTLLTGATYRIGLIGGSGYGIREMGETTFVTHQEPQLQVPTR